MVGGVADLGQALEVRRLAHVAAQQMRQADDGVHRRADLVAHVGEEGALGLRRCLGDVARVAQLAVDELQLEPVAFQRRDVVGDDEETTDMALVKIRDVVDRGVTPFAIRIALVALEVLRFAGQRGANAFPVRLQELLAQDVFQRAADQLVACPAGPIAVRLVDEAAEAVAGPEGDPGWQGVGGHAQKRLGIHQGRIGPQQLARALLDEPLEIVPVQRQFGFVGLARRDLGVEDDTAAAGGPQRRRGDTEPPPLVRKGAGVFEREALAPPLQHVENAVRDGDSLGQARGSGGVDVVRTDVVRRRRGRRIVVASRELPPGGVDGDDHALRIEHRQLLEDRVFHGLHEFGCIAQPGLGFVPVGDVARAPEQADHLAVGIVQRHLRDMEHPRPIDRLHRPDRGEAVVAVDHFGVVRGHERRFRCRQEGARVVADGLCPRPTERPLGRRIEQQVASAHVLDEDDIDGLLVDRFEQLQRAHALLKRLLSRLGIAQGAHRTVADHDQGDQRQQRDECEQSDREFRFVRHAGPSMTPEA